MAALSHGAECRALQGTAAPVARLATIAQRGFPISAMAGTVASEGAEEVMADSLVMTGRRDPVESRYLLAALTISLASAFGNSILALTGGLYADDYREMSRTAIDPWSFGSILWEDANHFAPLVRLHFSVFVELAPLSHGFAVAVTSFELAAALMLTYLVARRLFDGPWAITALVLVATTPLLTATNAWLIQAVSLYGVVIGVQMAALGLLGYTSDGRRRWLVLATAGWLLAAGTWETWLAGPPILFLLLMLLQDANSLEGRVLRTIRIAWPFWLATTVILALYLASWRLLQFGTGAEPPSPSGIVAAVFDFWHILLIPGFFGGPWNWYAGEDAYSPIATPGSRAVLAVVVFTAFSCGAFVRARGRSVQGLTLFLGASALVVLLPILGRVGQFPEAVVREPRYLAPALWVAAIGLVMLVQALKIHDWSVRARRLGTVGIAIVLLGIISTDIAFVRYWERNPSDGYVSTARASLEGTPTAGIFDTRVPNSVLSNVWFPDYATTRAMLRPLVRDDIGRFGAPGSRLMFDETGTLIPARFYPLSWAELYSCRAVGDGRTVEIPLPEVQVHKRDLTLRIEASAQQAGSLGLTVTSGDDDAQPHDLTPMPVEAGENERYFLLPARSIASVGITSEDTFSCISTVVVGQPAP